MEKLRAAGVDAFGVPLDVTDDASVAAAAALIERARRAPRRAGQQRRRDRRHAAGRRPTVDRRDARADVVETNVIGVIRVTNAMLPLLRRSASPRIVNMSSSVGSLARQTDPRRRHSARCPAAYSPSKTFLNAVTVQYAKELADTNILINAACPGYVATDLNGFRGFRTPRAGRRRSRSGSPTLPDDGPTGGFFDDAGPIPW